MTHQVKKILYKVSDVVEKIDKAAQNLMINPSNNITVNTELAALGSYLKSLRDLVTILNSLGTEIKILYEFTKYFEKNFSQINANRMHPDIIYGLSKDLREKCSSVRKEV